MAILEAVTATLADKHFPAHEPILAVDMLILAAGVIMVDKRIPVPGCILEVVTAITVGTAITTVERVTMADGGATTVAVVIMEDVDTMAEGMAIGAVVDSTWGSMAHLTTGITDPTTTVTAIPVLQGITINGDIGIQIQPVIPIE